MEEEKDDKAGEEDETRPKPFKWEISLRLDPDYPMDWQLRW